MKWLPAYQKGWHRWFAWRPVETMEGYRVWLQPIWRCWRGPKQEAWGSDWDYTTDEPTTPS